MEIVVALLIGAALIVAWKTGFFSKLFVAAKKAAMGSVVVAGIALIAAFFDLAKGWLPESGEAAAACLTVVFVLLLVFFLIREYYLWITAGRPQISAPQAATVATGPVPTTAAAVVPAVTPPPRCCPNCRGSGVEERPCSTCNGAGEFRCDAVYSKPFVPFFKFRCMGGRIEDTHGPVVCPNCNGRGFVPCDSCRGMRYERGTCWKCSGKGTL